MKSCRACGREWAETDDCVGSRSCEGLFLTPPTSQQRALSYLTTWTNTAAPCCICICAVPFGWGTPILCLCLTDAPLHIGPTWQLTVLLFGDLGSLPCVPGRRLAMSCICYMLYGHGVVPKLLSLRGVDEGLLPLSEPLPAGTSGVLPMMASLQNDDRQLIESPQQLNLAVTQGAHQRRGSSARLTRHHP